MLRDRGTIRGESSLGETTQPPGHWWGKHRHRRTPRSFLVQGSASAEGTLRADYTPKTRKNKTIIIKKGGKKNSTGGRREG